MLDNRGQAADRCPLAQDLCAFEAGMQSRALGQFECDMETLKSVLGEFSTDGGLIENEDQLVKIRFAVQGAFVHYVDASLALGVQPLPELIGLVTSARDRMPEGQYRHWVDGILHILTAFQTRPIHEVLQEAINQRLEQEDAR